MSKENLGRKHKRYIKDVFTTLIDAKWRWTFAVFVFNFLSTWTLFACFWYAMAFARGDIDYYDKWLDAIDKNAFEMEFPRTPCVRHLYSFTSAFLFSIETQHTIGKIFLIFWRTDKILKMI
jgi:potassium inwardly-rectifying channel subfamily J